MFRQLAISAAILVFLALLTCYGHTQQPKLRNPKPVATTAQNTIQAIRPPQPQPTISLEDLKKAAEERAQVDAEERRGAPTLSRINVAAQQKNNVDSDIVSVVIIMNSENNTQLLVLDNSGNWLADVREIKMSIAINIGQKPTVECIMYRGFLRPKNPVVQTFELESVVLADAKEFEDAVNKLHEKNSK